MRVQTRITGEQVSVADLEIWTWLGSLSPDTEYLLALVIAALPGKEEVAELLEAPTSPQKVSLGWMEAGLLGDLLQVVAEQGLPAATEAAARFMIYILGGDPTTPDPTSELARLQGGEEDA